MNNVSMEEYVKLEFVWSHLKCMNAYEKKTVQMEKHVPTATVSIFAERIRIAQHPIYATYLNYQQRVLNQLKVQRIFSFSSYRFPILIDSKIIWIRMFSLSKLKFKDANRMKIAQVKEFARIWPELQYAANLFKVFFMISNQWHFVSIKYFLNILFSFT